MQVVAGKEPGGKRAKEEVVHPVRLERTTIRLEGGCSIQLSYGCTAAVVSRLGATGASPGTDRLFTHLDIHFHPAR